MMHSYGTRSVYFVLFPCLLLVFAGQYLFLGSTQEPNHSLSASAPLHIAMLNIRTGKMDFSTFGLYQLSAVRNAIYAKLHGYDYVLVEDEEAPDGRNGAWWAKVGNIGSVLKDFDLVVYMDLDVYINNITMPFESLLDHWGFTCSHELLMALDPDKPYNHVELASNGTRILNLNAGFMVVRNTPEMISMFKEWHALLASNPDDQRVFNSHIREKLPAGKLLVLPCREANGGDPAWNKEDPGCNGTHIQHAWLGKDYIETRVRTHILEDILLTLPIERRSSLMSDPSR